MSKLAKTLPTPEAVATRTRRGPSGACDAFGDGDLEDWRAVHNLRRQTSWKIAQREVEKALGITASFDPDKFRYHFMGRCWHWTPEQKQTIRAEMDAGQ